MSRRAGDFTPLSKQAYVSMHEWVHGKCIKPGGTAGVIMKCIALVPAIFCEGQGLFYFKKYSVGNSLKQKSPPAGCALARSRNLSQKRPRSAPEFRLRNSDCSSLGKENIYEAGKL